MSFGFSIGDFLTILELAKEVRRKWIDAPSEYAATRNEAKTLENILRDIEDLRQGAILSKKQDNNLRHASESCRCVLEQCIRIVDKYSRIANPATGVSKHIRRKWTRFKLDPEDVRNVRGQMSSVVVQLTAIRDAIQEELIRHIDETLDEVLEDTDGLRASDLAREKIAIADWYSPTSFADQQNEFSRQRQKGTGRWFLTDDRYKDWSQSQSPPAILLCPGIPGSGKTMIVSTVINDLRDYYMGESSVVVAYFYCNFNRRSEQDLDQIYACLVRQLFQEQSMIPEAVRNLYVRHEDRGARPSTEDLTNLLQLLTHQHQKVFILIDALDKCNIDKRCREQLLDELVLLQENHNNADVRILLTTRFVPEVISRFSQFPTLEVRAEKNDIAHYLNSRMPEVLCVLDRYEIQRNIVSQITDISDGMFLLVRLHFESLLDCTNRKDLQRTLEGLPKGEKALFQAYNAARDRIDQQSGRRRALAHKALGWITYARRELSIEELQEALAIEPGMKDLDHENDIDDENTIVSVSAGLITIDSQSRIVRLVHLTTQEYLERVREDWLPNSQSQIVQDCLIYLSMEELYLPVARWGMNFAFLQAKYKLLKYAGEQWGFHMADLDDAETEAHALEILGNDEKLCFISQIMDTKIWEEGDVIECDRQDISALHVGVHFGVLKLCQQMIMQGCDIDVVDSEGETALIWTVHKKKADIARMLLKEPWIDINLSDYNGQSLLSWAAEYGRKEIVIAALERVDIDVNKPDDRNRTPLWWAARYGHTDVVKVLLARPDLDINSQADADRTALWWAVDFQHQDVVELLLQHPDIDVNCRDESNRTPLAWAARRGRKDMVKRLLQHPNIELNAVDNGGQTPLGLAVEYQQTTVVELLLQQSDINVNTWEPNKITPLIRATRSKDKKLIEMLLHHPNIIVNPQQADGWTPLAEAMTHRSTEIEEFLLARCSVSDRDEAQKLVEARRAEMAKNDLEPDDAIESWAPQQLVSY